MPDERKPFTSSHLSPLWLKLTGRDKWKPVVGFVFTSEYVARERKALAHYHVVYSYKVEEERYVGKFDDFSSYERFKRGDPIRIAFDDQNPSRSYYPEQLTDTVFFIATLAAGGLIGLIVVVANLMSR